MESVFNRLKQDFRLLWRPIVMVIVVLGILQMIFNTVCPMKIIWGIQNNISLTLLQKTDIIIIKPIELLG